jgi:hypothetical protein
MRIGDRVLLYVMAIGSIILTVAMLVLVGISLVAGNLIAASIFGLAFIGLLPMAVYSAGISLFIGNATRLPIFDMGGLDPETFFNSQASEARTVEKAIRDVPEPDYIPVTDAARAASLGAFFCSTPLEHSSVPTTHP